MLSISCSHSVFRRPFPPPSRTSQIKGKTRPGALHPISRNFRISESHSKSSKNVSNMWYYLKHLFMLVSPLLLAFSFSFLFLCCWKVHSSCFMLLWLPRIIWSWKSSNCSNKTENCIFGGPNSWSKEFYWLKVINLNFCSRNNISAALLSSQVQE